MSEHPSAQLLERFVLGELSPAEATPVVVHLLRKGGCARCRARLAPHYHFLADPDAAPAAPEAAGEELERYERAIDSAAAAVRVHGAQAVRLRSRARQLLAELGTHGVGRVSARTRGAYPKYEAVLAYSWSLRHSDPQRMVDYAYLATRIARHLGRDGYGAEQVADFEARAWGELANACRVADRFAEAESAMARAFALFATGSGEPLLQARLLELRGSQLGLQGQHRAALKHLDSAQQIYLGRHDRQAAGRVLITRGVYSGYAGQPQRGLRDIERGLAMIDGERDRELADTALYNQIDLLVESRRWREARALLWRHRPRLAALGELVRPRLDWLDGRVNAGLGELGRAERAFAAARAGFARAGAGRHAALVALDLTTVWMRQGRLEEAHGLAEAAIGALLAVQAPPDYESITALVLLRSSFQAALATAAQVQSVVEFLRRVEHDPGARYRFGEG